MPEGDTILWAATRMRPLLEGRVPDAIETPHARTAAGHWPERLAGRELRRIETCGKHLFLVFAGGLQLHSHLRMTGAWDVHPLGGRWLSSPRRAWLLLRSGDNEVIEYDGPVLELLTDMRRRSDQRLATLGPDLLADEFDGETFLRRWRAQDQRRAVGLALVLGVRPLMLKSGHEGPLAVRPRVYGHAGRPCPRCGTLIRARGQGDQNRTLYWCPGCQR
jgi:endonuclease-8